MASRRDKGRDNDAFDLAGALAGIRPPPDEPIEAGFFHRTLARWLGLPEGRSPVSLARGARGKDAPVLWSYGFWKAELHPAETQVAADGRRREVWQAHVYRTSTAGESAADVFSYWLELDDKRRIRRSGWLSTPPDLLADASAPSTPTARLTDAQQAALFADD
jgi:hypothetical protein